MAKAVLITSQERWERPASSSMEKLRVLVNLACHCD